MYPRSAFRSGTEGWVDLEAALELDGAVRRVRVVDSFPSGTFEEAAAKALARWRYSPRDGACRVVGVRIIFAHRNGQIREVASKLERARYHLGRCEFSAAAFEARRVRSGSSNPQVVLESALIEAAAIEGAGDGDADDLLRSYAALAPDTETLDSAQGRARRYVPDHCGDRTESQAQ